MTEPLQTETVRADIWLWAARFFKTRALAKAALAAGKVEANGQPCKPSRPLRIGDRLRVVRGEERFEIEIRGLAQQRGSAATAQTLYLETEESRTAREVAREQRRLIHAGQTHPPSRPDKKARRQIRALQQKRETDLPPWFPR